jgi:hypothetical protein
MSNINMGDCRTVQLFVKRHDVADRERFLFLKKECNIVIAVNLFNISVTF